MNRPHISPLALAALTVSMAASLAGAPAASARAMGHASHVVCMPTVAMPGRLATCRPRLHHPSFAFVAKQGWAAPGLR
jgi:hypothetical protein